MAVGQVIIGDLIFAPSVCRQEEVVMEEDQVGELEDINLNLVYGNKLL